MKRTILALAVAGLSVAAYASPPPGSGSPAPRNVNVTNPVLQVEVANKDPVPVSGPTPTYGYEQQSLTSQRTLDIPAGVVLTDLRIRWLSGDSPCWIYLREIVTWGDSTALVAIDSLYPADGQPVELHWESGIPSDGDVGIFVNGSCTIHTVWSGYTP